MHRSAPINLAFNAIMGYWDSLALILPRKECPQKPWKMLLCHPLMYCVCHPTSSIHEKRSVERWVQPKRHQFCLNADLCWGINFYHPPFDADPLVWCGALLGALIWSSSFDHLLLLAWNYTKDNGGLTFGSWYRHRQMQTCMGLLDSMTQRYNSPCHGHPASQ